MGNDFFSVYHNQTLYVTNMINFNIYMRHKKICSKFH